MSKDKNNKETSTFRISARMNETIDRYAMYGFESKTDFLNKAVEYYELSLSPEVKRGVEIMNLISESITVMEAERDINGMPDDSYPADKQAFIDQLYKAAENIASAKLMLDSPLCYMPYPQEMRDFDEEHDENEKLYRFQWALNNKSNE